MTLSCCFAFICCRCNIPAGLLLAHAISLWQAHMLTLMVNVLLSCSTFSIIAANSSSPVALQAAAAGSQAAPACLPPSLVQQLFCGLLQLLPDLAAGPLQQLAMQLLLRLAETGEQTPVHICSDTCSMFCYLL